VIVGTSQHGLVKSIELADTPKRGFPDAADRADHPAVVDVGPEVLVGEPVTGVVNDLGGNIGKSRRTHSNHPIGGNKLNVSAARSK
jgi:hypothetical protein